MFRQKADFYIYKSEKIPNPSSQQITILYSLETDGQDRLLRHFASVMPGMCTTGSYRITIS